MNSIETILGSDENTFARLLKTASEPELETLWANINEQVQAGCDSEETVRRLNATAEELGLRLEARLEKQGVA